MNYSFNSIIIIDHKELKENENNFNVTNVIILPNTKKGDKYLITFNDPSDQIITKTDGNKEIHNVNISIASAVTAYARMELSKYKNNPLLHNLYYTDTSAGECQFRWSSTFQAECFSSRG